MKNLILTSNAYFPSIGGIENSLRHLAQEAANLGYSTTLVVADIGVHPPLKKVRRETIDEIPVIRYPLKPISMPVFRQLNLLVSCFICWRIYRELHKESPQSIVVARFHFNALLAVWAGFKETRYLVPSVSKLQYETEFCDRSFFKRCKDQAQIALHNLVQKMALLRCRNFVFSETMRSQCVAVAKNSSDEYRLVKPGVDQNRFYPLINGRRESARAAYGFSSEDRVLLFVGRFVKAKGVDIVLEALSLADDQRLKLMIVGEGSEEENFRKLISQLGLRLQVSIFPATRSVEIFYQIADVFVMSSRYEPLGQTILEAFSCGLPVLAFRPSNFVNTATQELDMDECICYVEEFTPSALARQLKQVKHLSHQNALVIHDRAKEKFSWLSLCHQMVGGR
jgi:1,2-diacylglycerol 3-alpha-glucosyltransferase